MGGRGDRAGVAAWALEAWCVLGRGDPGGRERSPGGAEAPRGRASQRGSGRGGPGPRCEASAGPPAQVQGSPGAREQRSPERWVSGTPSRKGARARSASGAVGPGCGRDGVSVCRGGGGGADLAGCPLSAGVRCGRVSLWSVRLQALKSSDSPQPPLFSACRFSPRKRSAVRSDS